MGTRSFVGVMVGDVCRAVYVHWDGYLEGVGAALQDYTTQAAVEELISHGDRATLTGYYYKDGDGPADYTSFEEFLNDAIAACVEYYYIFKDGVWYCGVTFGHTPVSRKLVPYKEAVAQLRALVSHLFDSSNV